MSDESNKLRIENDIGKKGEHNAPSSEYQPSREYSNATETQRFSEFPEGKEKTTAQKSQSSAVLQKILVAAVAIVAVVFYDLLGMTPSSGASIREYSIESEENAIFYWFEFENYTYGDDLSIEVYNDFVHYSQVVEEQSVSGEAFDLKAEMTYTVEVRSGNSVLLRERVITRPWQDQAG